MAFPILDHTLDIAVRKNWESHIDASHSRQPLVKGERLVRYEVNAVILLIVIRSSSITIVKSNALDGRQGRVGRSCAHRCEIQNAAAQIHNYTHTQTLMRVSISVSVDSGSGL